MIIWLAFGLINVVICLLDIYKQGFCKAVDLLSTLVMFLGGPFTTILVLLHFYAKDINNVLERTVWQKHKSYNEYLENYKSKRGSN